MRQRSSSRSSRRRPFRRLADRDHRVLPRDHCTQGDRATAPRRGPYPRSAAGVTGGFDRRVSPWRASRAACRAGAPTVRRTGAAPSRDLEAVLTTRWGVWLGAAALVLAGVFLVRYAVDQGLLGPGPRRVFAGLLGAALIVSAEWLRRQEVVHPGIADQTAPGLAAGGVAVLFGASYGAGVLDALVSPVAGFVLMAGASPSASSLRCGMGNWSPWSDWSAPSPHRHWCRPRLPRCRACSPICCSSPAPLSAWCATRAGSGWVGRPRSPEPSGCWSPSRTGQAGRRPPCLSRSRWRPTSRRLRRSRSPNPANPARVAHHAESGAGDEQQIGEQARQRGSLGLHQCRCGEGADQSDHGDQLPMPQRNDEADQRGACHQHEPRHGRHQSVEHAGAIAGTEQHGDTAGGEARGSLIGDAGVDNFLPPQPLRADDQGSAKQTGEDAARAGAKQSLIRRHIAPGRRPRAPVPRRRATRPNAWSARPRGRAMERLVRRTVGAPARQAAGRPPWRSFGRSNPR